MMRNGRYPGELITANDWQGQTRTLVYKESGKPAFTEDIITDFRGDGAILVGGRAPHKSNSTGRIDVVIEDNRRREYFPSVFGLVWTS